MNPSPVHATDSSTPSSVDSASRRRPFGLYMILILLTLQAVIGVLVTTVVGLVLVLLPGEAWAELDKQIADIHIFDVVEPLVLLLITLVVVMGLWRYRTWGWYGMMLLLAYWMATDAVGYFTGNPNYGSMLLSVTMVFYLNQREVRDLFAAPTTAEVSV